MSAPRQMLQFDHSPLTSGRQVGLHDLRQSRAVHVRHAVHVQQKMLPSLAEQPSHGRTNGPLERLAGHASFEIQDGHSAKRALFDIHATLLVDLTVRTSQEPSRVAENSDDVWWSGSDYTESRMDSGELWVRIRAPGFPEQGDLRPGSEHRRE